MSSSSDELIDTSGDSVNAIIFEGESLIVGKSGTDGANAVNAGNATNQSDQERKSADLIKDAE